MQHFLKLTFQNERLNVTNSTQHIHSNDKQESAAFQSFMVIAWEVVFFCQQSKTIESHFSCLAAWRIIGCSSKKNY